MVVPARGVERWLTQRLSHRLGAGGRGGDGVCAGVRFLTPHSLVSTLLDRGRDDPWDPDQLVWPLLDVIDGAVGEPGLRGALAAPGPRRPAGRRPAQVAALVGRAPAGRAVLLLRDAAPPAGHRLVRGPRHRRLRRRAGRRPRLAARDVAAARRGAGGRRRRLAAGAAPRRGRGDRGGLRARPAAAPQPRRAHPAAGDRGRPAPRARPRPRGAPVAPAGLGRVVGRAGADRRRGPRRAGRGPLGRARRAPPARLAGPRRPRAAPQPR